MNEICVNNRGELDNPHSYVQNTTSALIKHGDGVIDDCTHPFNCEVITSSREDGITPGLTLPLTIGGTLVESSRSFESDYFSQCRLNWGSLLNRPQLSNLEHAINPGVYPPAMPKFHHRVVVGHLTTVLRMLPLILLSFRELEADGAMMARSLTSPAYGLRPRMPHK